MFDISLIRNYGSLFDKDFIIKQLVALVPNYIQSSNTGVYIWGGKVGGILCLYLSHMIVIFQFWSSKKTTSLIYCQY